MLELNRIYNMDCIEGLKRIKDNSIDAIITDPPYGISQEKKKISRRNLNSKSWKRNSDITLDFGEWDLFKDDKEFFEFTEKWFKECVRVLKPKGWIYVFFDKQKIGFFDLYLAKKYGIDSRTVLVWAKSNPTPSFRKVNWVSATEFIWVGSKGSSKLKNFLTQKEMYNYIITPNKSSYGITNHPTEKPLAVAERIIKASTLEGDIVLDAFVGSGTFMVACAKLRRRFIGFEKEKNYFDIANSRLGYWTKQTRL